MKNVIKNRVINIYEENGHYPQINDNSNENYYAIIDDDDIIWGVGDTMKNAWADAAIWSCLESDMSSFSDEEDANGTISNLTIKELNSIENGIINYINALRIGIISKSDYEIMLNGSSLELSQLDIFEEL